MVTHDPQLAARAQRIGEPAPSVTFLIGGEQCTRRCDFCQIDTGKPAEILEKIIGGKIAKIVNEVSLYGQPYVLNTDQSVEQAAKAAGADVVSFTRLAVGEGIEKVVEDYAAEVAKAMQV